MTNTDIPAGPWDDCETPRFSFVIDTKEVSVQDAEGIYQVKQKRLDNLLFLNLVGVGVTLNPDHRAEIEQAGFTILEQYELNKCDPNDSRVYTGYVLRKDFQDREQPQVESGGPWKPTVAQLKQLIADHMAMKSHPDNEDFLETHVFRWALKTFDSDKQIAKLKTAVQFYEDRLRPVTDIETGTTEDEIDRLTLALELAMQDKKRFAANLHDLQCTIQEATVEMRASTFSLPPELITNEQRGWNKATDYMIDLVKKHCGELL